MSNIPDLASIAALVGDPTRARMLTALMDGRARTATELALEGGVTPSTTSSHLNRLTAAGLVAITSQGRHHYFRIGTPEVAAAIEGLMSIAAPASGKPVRLGPEDEKLRHARVCYDHLAGEVAVALLDQLKAKELIEGADDTMALTSEGETWCARFGIGVAGLRASRRRLCRPCLDWSERKTHLAGSLGAAILARMVTLRYVRRERGSRVVVLSPKGEGFVRRLDM